MIRKLWRWLFPSKRVVFCKDCKWRRMFGNYIRCGNMRSCLAGEKVADDSTCDRGE